MDQRKQQVAMVTGGASGIGQALCHALSRHGVHVVVVDVNGSGAQQVVDAICAAGGQASMAPIDVSQHAAMDQVVTQTVAAQGRLDYLFNNAGISVGADVRDLQIEQWRRILDVNLWGVIYGSMAAYHVMVRQGFGHIINTASLAGLAGYPTGVPYATSKHGIVGLSLSLRAEGRDLGVKVSVACPGYVDTPIHHTIPMLNVRREQVLNRVPFKLLEPSAAADAILQGVARNQALIVFPFHARVLWWLTRIHPALGIPIQQRLIRNFRAARNPS